MEDNYIDITEHTMEWFEIYTDESLMTFTPSIDDIDIPELDNVQGLVKKDVIMKVFGCTTDRKALNILKDMVNCGCGFQLGKVYYTTKQHCKKYIIDNMGTRRYLEE